MPDLPSGRVTFLFTDIEGSTRLLESLGPDAYALALAEHRQIVRGAYREEGGVEVDTQGDAFLVAFAQAPAAVRAANEAQRRLADGPIRVRMGVHTGLPTRTADGYVGEDVHLGARIAAAAHGGQVVISTATHDLVAGVVITTDLGEHRLKDFLDPVWLYQVGAERFPPLRTISTTNMPRPVSSFVGRETELAAVSEMVTGGARLVTLTGPGGSGKTRLAIALATDLVPLFPNGVFWVDLAPLRDFTLVELTIGRAIGARVDLAEHIGWRRMLLVIDNLEQVVESAPALSSLLRSCPYLQMLITSRERLRVGGELEYAVLPMAASEAVQLYEARAARPADSVVAELCARLDYLPLAVELAAARADVLSPGEMLDRLGSRLDELKGGRDADPRHRTLRAAIDWSYQLLSADEQALAARLSVFGGGWTYDAAKVVCDADLDRLQLLVQKSLVQRAGDRFGMLETISEYSAEHLSSADSDALRRAHCEFYLGLAGDARAASTHDPAAFDQVERDYDNVRGALDWCIRDGDRGRALAALKSLWLFWLTRGRVAEGDRWAQRVLAVAGESARGAEAMALVEASELARFAGDPRRAVDLKIAALAFMGEGDELRAATARDLALVLLGLGDVDGAEAYAIEALDLQRELGQPGGVGHALFGIAEVAWQRGQSDRAIELMLQSAEEMEAAGDVGHQASSLEQVADFMRRSGNLEEARRRLEQALAVAEKAGDLFAGLWCLYGFGALLADEGDLERAVQVLAASEALADASGMSFAELPSDHAAKVAFVRTKVPDPEFERLWSRGATMTQKEAAELSVEHVAQ